MDARLAEALSDRYVIDRTLGAGGMATVWLAHDLKHERRVAIKVLHPQLSALLGAERFLKEIRTTAQLQHPHLLPLFDSGDVDGQLFYVMPFVDGESLRERITRERVLPVADAVRIASEVSGALDYAHRHGVVHRDIKPENILLHDGRALVADFGIALAPAEGDRRMTETGLSLGTPTYMSPEQALGEREIDARTDIYSIGALLYEMLTGAPPFVGSSAQAVVAKTLTATATRPSRLRKGVPSHVDSIVMTALQKKPADRFQTAGALQSALELERPQQLRWNREIRIAAIAGVALLTVAGFGYLVRHRGASGIAPVSLSIAAVPFLIQDSSDAYLGDQLPAEILDALTHVPELTVRPLAAAPRFRNSSDLQAIARELQVTTLLTGSVARQGGSLRVTARLYDAVRNQNMPTVTFTNNATNTFALEDSVSRTIAASFALKQSQVQTERQLAVARQGRTLNPAAHDTLMLARFFAEQRTPASLTHAIRLFRTTVSLDSTYADGWAGLANALSLRAVFGDSAPSPYFAASKVNVVHALALDSNSASAHTTLGLIKVFYDRDFSGAGPEFKKSISIDSMQSAAWLFQGWYFVSVNRLDSAIWSMKRGWEIDPASLIVGTRLAELYHHADSAQKAINVLQRILKVDKDFRFARIELADVYTDQNECGKAMATLPQGPSPYPVGSPEDARVATVEARCTEHAKTDAWVQTVEERDRQGQYVSAYSVARVFAARGQRENVFRWLRKAIATNDWGIFLMGSDPEFRSYHNDPEFQALKRNVGLL
jgi:TolB-like protein/tRNA A-37 threonylcarbamoyl transferase component Bud32